ncbi:3-phytase (myo-inositol-hexaphosphate 3-phosphohydrolase) [Methylophaga frappieri]|uniref:3-phytase (Myo-inositol-hexaphosphate 3-phosphohydrolase) n=2 Tax=Methylophaga frappieri (strain ATCC BAA-2434 / DSM 25690 / JAM7) TaxID=754477 RepID=I1YF50_METFJ|nr:3-phytase (myo-inositol-hexaphosphate 3-phosphohydrolase) [Methylophaga frappieri]
MACQSEADTSSGQTKSAHTPVESLKFLPTQDVLGGAKRLVSYPQHGIALTSETGKNSALLSGNYGQIDYRTDESQLLLATVDLDRQQALITTYSEAGWSTPVYLPQPDYKIESVCFYQDQANNAFLFLVGEQGHGEQWLVGHALTPIAHPQRVRGLSLPPNSEYCVVRDSHNQLFINEETVGIWAYDASPEADLQRAPIAMVTPFGDVIRSVADMSLVPGGIVFMDPENSSLEVYREIGSTWQFEERVSLPELSDAEQVSAKVQNNEMTLAILHDDGVYHTTLSWPHVAQATDNSLPVLPAMAETAPVPSLGDAADDPAIWLHTDTPENSRVIATDKQGGLLVYDLQGNELQNLPVGRLNNVDVRKGFIWGGDTIDIAVASNRDHNSLHVFAIQPDNGEVSEIGEIATISDDIYGLCLYQNDQDQIYAIANDKDGRFFQYLLSGAQGTLRGELKREFAVNTQPEGCVADDRTQQLFIGEENKAVWALAAEADASSEMHLVLATGDQLHADVEGMALYQAENGSYLVVSSQGNDSFVVLDSTPPYTYHGAFRIGFNTERLIDGVSETDGLDVISANLGGEWAQGILVVQDGRNRMPVEKQNYKYLPWSAVTEALNLKH